MQSDKSANRVLISTLAPLGVNYGGILQAYALQKYVRDMGFAVDTLSNAREGSVPYTLLRGMKRLVYSRLLGKPDTYIDREMSDALSVNTRSFIEDTMSLVDISVGPRFLCKYDVSAYGAFITGSDQVWRKKYTYVPFQLFDYTKNRDVVRISYAASFGKSDLSEYSAELLKKTKKLAKKFDGISVREDSGIDLVGRSWRLDAVHHVDPTLLLSADDYRSLVSREGVITEKSKGNMFVYVLDKTQSSQTLVESVQGKLGLKAFELLPKKYSNRGDLLRNPDVYALPSVEQWLRSFIESDFVVADSFHGTVFSIIFNKPFIVLGNQRRGMARFESLLRVFGLEDRLVYSEDGVSDEMLRSDIDWNRVNKIIESEQKRSREYLSNHLGRLKNYE